MDWIFNWTPRNKKKEFIAIQAQHGSSSHTDLTDMWGAIKNVHESMKAKIRMS